MDKINLLLKLERFHDVYCPNEDGKYYISYNTESGRYCYGTRNQRRVRRIGVEGMKRWKYTLVTGKSLREAILNDSNVETLKALGNCYKEIHRAMPGQYTEDDLEDELEEIENQLDNCRNYEDYDMTEAEVQDEINYMLRDFYDFCDANDIWVRL